MKIMHESAAALYPSAQAVTLTPWPRRSISCFGPGWAEIRTPALVTGCCLRAMGVSKHLAALAGIGFVPGETVQVLARGLGGDPLAVRVGRHVCVAAARGGHGQVNAGMRPEPRSGTERWGRVAHRHGQRVNSCAWPCWATPIAARRRCSTC